MDNELTRTWLQVTSVIQTRLERRMKILRRVEFQRIWIFGINLSRMGVFIAWQKTDKLKISMHHLRGTMLWGICHILTSFQ